MTLVLLLGGARSGKSALAVEIARHSCRDVVFVATAEAGDDEMRARIGRHRAERPSGWRTIEAPIDLDAALAAAAPDACLILDCLSLWLANLLEAGQAGGEIEALVEATASTAGARPGLTIAVSNEVGLGVVPATPLGRRYRDLMGRVNAIWAGAADEALLVVAGRVLPLAQTGGLVAAGVVETGAGDHE
jgi:adenosylcobinamide kinase / adenosylcobinamide-phosphate guanylyltransferase